MSSILIFRIHAAKRIKVNNWKKKIKQLKRYANFLEFSIKAGKCISVWYVNDYFHLVPLHLVAGRYIDRINECTRIGPRS